MKKPLTKLLFITSVLFFSVSTQAQNPVNWTDKQLIQPATLADIIKNNPKDVTIISVGPFNTIPGTIDIGMVSEPKKMTNFKTQLASIKKDAHIVIYCGCCPYEHCPNVRPAIDVLKEMKFTNYYLLDLPNNLRINWMDKGYPTIKL